MTDFADRVREVLRAVEPGNVVTYGEVAAMAGKPGAARGVGAILAGSGNDEAEPVPWWRVVNAAGRLVPGYETEHARRLQAEGVAVDGGFVRLSRARRGRGPATSGS